MTNADVVDSGCGRPGHVAGGDGLTRHCATCVADQAAELRVHRERQHLPWHDPATCEVCVDLDLNDPTEDVPVDGFAEDPFDEEDPTTADDLFDVPACRVCGCTEDRACPGGCWWVEDPEGEDLCSACAEKEGAT